MAAFLGQVGRREIDGDSPCRQRQPGSDQRRAHSLAGLGNRLVRQANDSEGRQSWRDLHLNIDGAGLDPLKSYRGNPLYHAAPLESDQLSNNIRRTGMGRPASGTRKSACATLLLDAVPDHCSNVRAAEARDGANARRRGDVDLGEIALDQIDADK